MPKRLGIFQSNLWTDDELYYLMRSVDIEGKTFWEIEGRLGKTILQIAAAWAYFRTPGQPYWSLARHKKAIEVSNQYLHDGKVQWQNIQLDGVLRREFPGASLHVLAFRAYELRKRGRSMDPFAQGVSVTIDQAFNPDYVPAVDPLSRPGRPSRFGTAAGLSAYREPASSSSSNAQVTAATSSINNLAISAPSASTSTLLAATSTPSAVTSTPSAATSTPSAATLTLAQAAQSKAEASNPWEFDYNNPFSGYDVQYDVDDEIDEDDEDYDEGGQGSSKR